MCKISEKFTQMRLCHQSRFVIDHYIAITASFDEHGSIRTSVEKNRRVSRPSRHTPPRSFSVRACQSGCEMFYLSYHSHFDVVGLRRLIDDWTAVARSHRGPLVKLAVSCYTYSYHSHILTSWTAIISTVRSIDTRILQQRRRRVLGRIKAARRSQSGCYMCF